ncbi:hypothetical protein F4780DRAFT_357752 [Xylariomycetidae sp. FL0641]|nr:hypothetical protein F4780DRAFT_357752 [Xylariomycetidae sp. FL0641]
MAPVPEQYEDGSPSLLQDDSGATWTPLYRMDCAFGPEIFSKVMMNLIRNPNINSAWLFRADILHEEDPQPEKRDKTPPSPQTIIVKFAHFDLAKLLVRRLIPRNPLRDQPLDQTCLLYHGQDTGELRRSLVVYMPHVSSPSEMPFYHPVVRGLAFLHEWHAEESKATISMHYCFFDDHDRDNKLTRTAFHLLSTLYKHGEGQKKGYVKKVHHDTIIPQAPFQTTYTRLKGKYARTLIENWAEVTDPTKHVFEDLGIAAFLIELWARMYQDSPFPGFVDIGCGNGLLVYILRQEGYTGWGFDARQRKSWMNYSELMDSGSGDEKKPSLRQHVLLPSIIQDQRGAEDPQIHTLEGTGSSDLLHDGLFPTGTFIISNHADELTPWTPILAALSDSPFIMIPCCSHDLSGARFRAPAPKQQGKPPSAYSSLVEWVAGIGRDCGWHVEKEMLRIPSTRNAAFIGRKQEQRLSSEELQAVVDKYGKTDGYLDNVIKLVKGETRGH